MKSWPRRIYELQSAGGASTSGVTTVAQGPIGFTDSTTPLAGGATFTGTARLLTAAGVSSLGYFSAEVETDQIGTLNIQKSLDTGATFKTIATNTVDPAQNKTAALRVAISGAAATTQYRVQFVNGATLQTELNLSSSFSL